MPPLIASVLWAIGIAGLFWLDRDRSLRTSKALWLPLAWLALASSRAASEWLAAFGWGDAAPALDSPQQVLSGSPVDRAVITGMLVIGLVILAGRAQQVRRLMAANLPIVLFFAYCMISIAWSDFPGVALKRWIKAAGDLVMVLIVLSERQPQAAIKRLLAWTSFLLIPLSVLLIKYYPGIGLVYNRWTWTPLYGGVTINKNSLGMICMVFALASEWQLLAALRNRQLMHRSGKMAAHAAILLMALWLFWKANSMTALSCFLMGTGLILATTFLNIRRRPAMVLTLVAALISISAYSIFMSSDAVETVGRNATLTGRTEIWRLALGMNDNPVVGSGFESFWLGERLSRMWAYDRDIHQAHNGYLEIYLNLGWAGVALLAAILASGLRKVLAALRRGEEQASLWLAFFAAALIYNFTEAAFTTMCTVWLVLLLTIMGIPRAAAAAAKAPLRREPAMPMIPLRVGNGFAAPFPSGGVNSPRRPQQGQ